MGREEDLKTELISSIINYVRAEHAEEIDKAYEYFWEETKPDEYLSGTALELGFINFEDWLLFDYRVNGQNESFVEVYLRTHGDLKDEEQALLGKIKDCLLGLYEVVSVSKDKRVLVRDLLTDAEFSLRDRLLTKGLKKGDLFATRFLHLDRKHVMSGCVYPYPPGQKKTVLEYVNKQFRRYIRNVNPDGTMKDYLRAYGDVFNLIWMEFILNQSLTTG